MLDTIAVILGGGRGTRLFPLTLQRSKPAVPIAGKYRLIDIPVSNCLHSNLRRIFVLTQFNSQSLNRHLGQTYKFDVFSSGFVSVLAAEQTDDSPEWFQGTADAVRQSLRHLRNHSFAHALILSGDQLYRMDYRRLQATHTERRADATVAVLPVTAEQAPSFGIVKVDEQGRIVHFEEKPRPERLPHLVSELPGVGRTYLASMGIYQFTRKALEDSLSNEKLVDFGRHVIPEAIPKLRVQSYLYRGYWEDVGTVSSYFESSLALTRPDPPFDFFEAGRPIFTHPRFLPATRVEQCTLKDTLLSEGCVLRGADVAHSIIGIRTWIGPRTQVRDSLLLGADLYETPEMVEEATRRGLPPIGIGAGSIIQRAIVDKNARIGRGVRIANESRRENADGDGWYIRDGIVLIPKNGVIADGTTI
jgi:glucose-1-phosphate adenylyltransferase